MKNLIVTKEDHAGKEVQDVFNIFVKTEENVDNILIVDKDFYVVGEIATKLKLKALV